MYFFHRFLGFKQLAAIRPFVWTMTVVMNFFLSRPYSTKSILAAFRNILIIVVVSVVTYGCGNTTPVSSKTLTGQLLLFSSSQQTRVRPVLFSQYSGNTDGTNVNILEKNDGSTIQHLWTPTQSFISKQSKGLGIVWKQEYDVSGTNRIVFQPGPISLYQLATHSAEWNNIYSKLSSSYQCITPIIDTPADCQSLKLSFEQGAELVAAMAPPYTNTLAGIADDISFTLYSTGTTGKPYNIAAVSELLKKVKVTATIITPPNSKKTSGLVVDIDISTILPSARKFSVSSIITPGPTNIELPSNT